MNECKLIVLHRDAEDERHYQIGMNEGVVAFIDSVYPVYSYKPPFVRLRRYPLRPFSRAWKKVAMKAQAKWDRDEAPWLTLEWMVGSLHASNDHAAASLLNRLLLEKRTAVASGS